MKETAHQADSKQEDIKLLHERINDLQRVKKSLEVVLGQVEKAEKYFNKKQKWVAKDILV